MAEEKTRLPLLEQREIEARIVGPLIRAFARELGEPRALEIVRQVIIELARQSGAELARSLGDQSLESFARTLGRWCENDALELEMLEQSPEQPVVQRRSLQLCRDVPGSGPGRPWLEPFLPARFRSLRRVQPRDPAHANPNAHGRRGVLRFSVPPCRGRGRQDREERSSSDATPAREQGEL